MNEITHNSRWRVQGFIRLEPLDNVNLIQESVGEVYAYSESWKIFYQIGYHVIEERMLELRNSERKIIDICGIDRCTFEMRTEFDDIKQLMLELKEQYQNVLYQSGVGKTNSERRRKRGVLDLIGTIHKFLYGTLDANDLKVINENFDNIKNSSDHMIKAIDKQTFILREVVQNINHNEKTIKETFDQIAEKLNYLSRNYNDQDFQLKMVYALNKMTLGIQMLKSKVSTISNAITFGHRGIVSPQLFTPEMLIKAMKTFEAQNGEHLLKLTENNYEVFMKIANLNVLTGRNTITYIIEIPNLEKEPWEWILNTMIPQINAESRIYYMYKPTFNQRLQRGSITRSADDLNIITINNQLNIVKYQGIGHEMQSIELCETHINNKTCKIILFKMFDIGLIPTSRGNQIIVPHEIPLIQAINITCPKGQLSVMISQVSLIVANESCQLNTKRSIIQLTKEITRSFNDSLKIVINFTFEISKNTPTPNFAYDLSYQVLNDYKLTFGEIQADLNQSKITILHNDSWANFKGITLPSIQGIFGLIGLGTILYLLYQCGGLSCLSSAFRYCCSCNKTKGTKERAFQYVSNKGDAEMKIIQSNLEQIKNQLAQNIRKN